MIAEWRVSMDDIEKAIECCERFKAVTEVYGSANSSKADIKSFDLAISALEKQIPKKPILRIENAWNEAQIPIYECCSCGCDNISGELNYCFECGQAIDWSVEE